VATLEEIGQDWGKRLEKGLAKDWMFFFGIFLARSSFHRWFVTITGGWKRRRKSSRATFWRRRKHLAAYLELPRKWFKNIIIIR
jgi:hypothetical protein